MDDTAVSFENGEVPDAFRETCKLRQTTVENMRKELAREEALNNELEKKLRKLNADSFTLAHKLGNDDDLLEKLNDNI